MADTADLKSAALNKAWGFDSPLGHHFKKQEVRYILLNIGKLIFL